MSASPRGLAGALTVALLGCSRSEGAKPLPAPAPVAAARTPALAAPPAAVRFAAIGDFGADSPTEADVARLVKSWDPAFIITVGDNNYPRGEAATIDVNIGKHYASFIGHYRGAFGPGSPQNRFFPSLGNHDWLTPSASPYLDYFTLPGNERYYDVDLGIVHLYALDSDEREPDGLSATSPQASWLKQRLATSTSCYDVVYFHHPAYSTGPHGSALTMRWPFRAWGAEVVLAGHDHTYERFQVDGIPYFVNGLGGASRYEFASESAEHSERRYNAGYGAMLIAASPQEIAYDFITVDGERRDRFTWRHPSGAAVPCGPRADTAP